MHSRTSQTPFLTLRGYHHAVIEYVNFLIHYESDCGYKGCNNIAYAMWRVCSPIVITRPPVSCRKDQKLKINLKWPLTGTSYNLYGERHLNLDDF